MNPKFKSLIQHFQKLPGVGPRQAARFVLALLERDEKELKEFGMAISGAKKDINFCKECFNLTDDPICIICSNLKRDKSKIMVVEKVTDLTSIEKTGIYKGLYHVLGGAINPLDKITPDTLTISQLKKRADKFSKEKPIELIIATNPSTSGDTTALYIKQQFQKNQNIKITTLARGLSSGSYLEYADESTLKNALENRGS